MTNFFIQYRWVLYLYITDRLGTNAWPISKPETEKKKKNKKKRQIENQFNKKQNIQKRIAN